MKRFLGLTVMALLVGTFALTAQEKKDPPKETKKETVKETPKETPKEAPAAGDDYYPLKKDATWTYEVSGGEIQVKCVGHDTFGGEDCFKLETTANGKVAATEHVKIQKDGFYRFGVNGTKPDMPIKFFALPPDDKAPWSIDTKVQGQEIKGSFSTKKEDVTIGTTTYKTILVESKDLKIGGMDTSIKQWFAPGVGIVKLDFKLGGQDAELKLKKFEPGK